MQYEVQHYTLCDGWNNNWTICDDGITTPHVFDTKEEEQSELDEFFEDIAADTKSGVRAEDEGYSINEFRVVEVEVEGA